MRHGPKGSTRRWWGLSFIAAGLAAGLLASAWITGGILSAPSRAPVGSPPADLPARAVEFASSSGAVLRGWLLEGQKGAGAIILMHGVRANRLSMVDRARFLSRAGYAVLLFDFQAHGESSGPRITFGYLESRDARSAVEFLHGLMPEEKIGIIGVSLGGASAVLASPALEVNALVLESVYPTIDQAISDRLAMRLGGWSRSLAPLLASQFEYRLGFDAGALRPIDKIGSIGAPKLLIAGTEDRHTTLDESKQLFAAAGPTKEFWAVEGAQHVDLHEFAREEYERRVLSFLDEHLR